MGKTCETLSTLYWSNCKLPTTIDPQITTEYKPTLLVVLASLIDVWAADYRAIGLDKHLTLKIFMGTDTIYSTSGQYYYRHAEFVSDVLMKTGAFDPSDPNTQRAIKVFRSSLKT